MPLVADLVDDFEGPTLDTLTPAGAGLAGGALYVNVHGTGPGAEVYSNARSDAALTWTGSSLTVEVDAMPAGVGGHAQIWLRDATPVNAVDRLGFEYLSTENRLDLLGQTAGYTATIGPTTSLTYDPVAMRWLRIENTGTAIVWSTSPDGLDWTVQRTYAQVPAWAAGDDVQLSIEGYRNGDGPQDTLRIASMNVVPGPPADGTPDIREVIGGTANPDDVNGGDLTLTTSADVEVGDLLVVFQGHDYGPASAMLAPGGTDADGWELVAEGNPNEIDQVHEYVWTRRVTTAGVQTITDSGGASSSDITVHVVVLDGATLPADPVDGGAGTVNGGGSLAAEHVAPGVSPEGPASLLLCGFASQQVVDYTAPPGMTPVGDELDGRTWITQRVYSEVLDAAGPTDTRTATADPARGYAAATVAFRGAVPDEPEVPDYVGPVDDFTAGTLDLWPASYGGVSVVAGRARVVCEYDDAAAEPAWSGVQTAGTDNRPLTGRSFHVEVPTVPAQGGAAPADEVRANLWLASASGPDGVRLGWSYDANTGLLYATSQGAGGDAAYADSSTDPAALGLTYSPITHRWWKVEHTGTVIRWSTSQTGQDGSWIARRVLATPPAWTAEPDVRVALESYRYSGAADFAEFDNVNVVPTGPVTVQAASAGDASSAGTATPAIVAASGASTGSTAAGDATATRVSALAARATATGSSSVQATASLGTGSAGTAGSASSASGLRVVLASASASATASGQGDLRPSGAAGAAGTATGSGSAAVTRVVALTATAGSSATAGAHPVRVASSAASSTASTAAGAEPGPVARPRARSRAVALGRAGVAAVGRLAARLSATAVGRATPTRATGASAAETAHTAATATPRAVTPGAAREDATATARAHSDPVGRDLAGAPASSGGAAHPGRVVPCSARGAIRAGAAGHATAVRRPAARGLVEVATAAHPRRVARPRATASASWTGWVGAPERAVRLRAAATCTAAPRAHARAVGAGTASSSAGTATGTPAQVVVPSSAASPAHGLGLAAVRAVCHGHARDLAGAAGISTPRPVARPTARAGAQVDGDATARTIGTPGARGSVAALGAVSAGRVSHARALADTAASGWTGSGPFTAAGSALGAVTAAGVVTRAVDIPGHLDPGATQAALDAAAAPSGLAATAHPAHLEVTLS